MEVENSRTESLVARLIYDALETGKFKPHNFPMTDKDAAAFTQKLENRFLPNLDSNYLQLHT